MSDFSNINFDLEEEEEYTPTVDFSGIDFDSEPESSISRESKYGTAQEPMLLGSAASLLTSGIKSIFSDKTFAEEKIEAERKRQAGIDIEFPEFAAYSPEEETGAMLAGRIGTAIVDPLPWLVPWTRLGKLEKGAGLATVGAGAGLGLADSLTREIRTKDDISAANVALGTAFGAGAAGISHVVSRYVNNRALKDVAADLDDAEKVAPTPSPGQTIVEIKPPEVKRSVNSEGELPPMREVIRDYRRRLANDPLSFLSDEVRLRRGEILLTDESTSGDFVRAFNRVQLGLPQSMNVRLAPQVQEELTEVTTEVATKSKFKTVQTKLVNDIEELNKVTGEFDVLDKKLRKKKTVTTSDNSALEILKTRKEALENKILLESTESTVDTAVEVMEELGKKGNINEGVMNALLQNLTGPAFLSIGGAAIGAGTLDPDEDPLTHIGFYAAGGLALSLVHKRIKNSKSLSTVNKETAEQTLNAHTSRFWRSLNVNSSTTTVTRANEMGGWTKVIANKLFNNFGSEVDSVESRTLRKQSEFLGRLFQIFDDPSKGWLGTFSDKGKKMFNTEYVGTDPQTEAFETVVGEVMNGFTSLGRIREGYKGLSGNLQPLTKESVARLDKAVSEAQALRDSIAVEMNRVGINFKELKDYGMTQVWNVTKARENVEEFVKDLKYALELQTKKSPEDINADDMASKILREGDLEENAYKDRVFSTEEGKPIFRAISKFFETERRLTDIEARKYMYERGWLNLKASDALSAYGTNSIKAIEFADAFGPNGEVINIALQKIQDSINKVGTHTLAGKHGQKQKQHLQDFIKGYWGFYGKQSNDQVSTVAKWITGLANTSYLTTVSISNLADLVQPFVNSSFGSAAKAAMQTVSGEGKRFSEISHFKYDQSFARDLASFTNRATYNKYGTKADEINDWFFHTVLLPKVTSVSRNFAYDTGVHRAFELSRKKTFNARDKMELKELKLTNNIQELAKYKTVEEAFDNSREILDVAGRAAADRDAIIPLVGNRLLFSQSNSPYVRSLGQFMSWASAKTAQVNYLMTRIENGDAKLALKILGSIPIYAGIKELKNILNPNYVESKHKRTDETTELINKAGSALSMSGQFENVMISKLVNSFDSMQYQSVLESASPTADLIGSLGRDFKDVITNAGAGDMEGAAKKLLEALPGFSHSLGWYEKIVGEPLLENKPNRESKRKIYEKGGFVEDVPRTSKEPDQRIDKVTGIPYDQQAGTAFVDVEDPLRRLGFSEGGETDDPSTFGTRSDGSSKSTGYLGPVINNITGETMTEVSITLDIDGKKVTMPSMVPTLTQKEINILANMPIENNFKNIPQSIIDKAVDHYFKRLDEGKSAFYQDGEDLQGDSEK